MFLKKSFKTTDEFYKAVENLAELFDHHGFEKESKKLDILIHGVWTTGSELIGEIMLYLESLNTNFPKDIINLKNRCHYFAKNHRKILGLD